MEPCAFCAHRQAIWTVEPAEARAAMDLAQRLAHVMRDDLGAVGVNQNSGSRAGQDVFHFHVHVVPRYEEDTVVPFERQAELCHDPTEDPPSAEVEVASAVQRRGEIPLCHVASECPVRPPVAHGVRIGCESDEVFEP
jgi:diadenosine tetraphosphate (Ap4A) HIT family hydrolase